MSPQDELPELDANELALLAAFAQEEQLPPTTHQRVKARVLESTAPLAPTGTVLRGPWLPWVAGTVLAAAAAALLVVTMGGNDVTAVNDRGLQQAPDTPESAQEVSAHHGPATPDPTPRTSAAPRSAPVEEAPAEHVSGPITAPPAEPATPRRSSPAPRKPAEPVDAAEPVETPSATSLAEETRLLDRARRALLKNWPKMALGLIREAEERFPNGVLRQERAVLRVMALCDAGRVADGREAIAAFRRAYPRSALRSRVESACPQPAP